MNDHVAINIEKTPMPASESVVSSTGEARAAEALATQLATRPAAEV